MCWEVYSGIASVCLRLAPCRVCVCVCVRACVRACVCACVRVCACGHRWEENQARGFLTHEQARDLYAQKDLISTLLPLREKPGTQGDRDRRTRMHAHTHVRTRTHLPYLNLISTLLPL